MSIIADKIKSLGLVKADLKDALSKKGQNPGDTLSTYPDLIRNIETGGSIDESSLFKISGIYYETSERLGEAEHIKEYYPDYYTKFISNGFTKNNTSIMSPRQPFLDLVFLPKVKINDEDWIEKRGYGIYTGDPQYIQGINKVELYFKEDQINNIIFFGTDLYNVDDLNSILNTKDVEYPKIPDNFF